ncbi:hypothetical protein HDV03_005087 [Kappamyces sp. JEL0829]|nr:hypothetical protein HDV03_005087 [Kappamyces sp. JEL0829]
MRAINLKLCVLEEKNFEKELEIFTDLERNLFNSHDDFDLPSIVDDLSIDHGSEAVEYSGHLALSPIPSTLPNPPESVLAVPEQPANPPAPPAPSLVMKYFLESNPPRKIETLPDEAKETADQQTKTVVEDLKTELAKAKLLCTKLKRERDDWERKEGIARTDKVTHSALIGQESQRKLHLQEMAQLREAQEEQAKRLQRERKLWEKQKKAADILPTKRERQEIELLAAQLNELNEQSRQKEARLLLAQDRLKKKVMELEKRNKELQEEVNVLERERASRIEVSIKPNVGLSHITKSKSVDSLPSKPKRSVMPVAKSTTDLPKAEIPRTLDARQGEDRTLAQPLVQKSSIIPHVSHPPPTTRSKILGGLVKPIGDADSPKETEVKREPKRATEFDAAKIDLDQLQTELHLERPVREICNEDGSRTRTFADGTQLVWLNDGKMKLCRTDDIQVLYFSNGDSKTVFPDSRVVFWYNSHKTRHTTYPDGLQICEYEDGQVEEISPDGKHVIQFPDGIIKTILPHGLEIIQYADGKYEEIEKKNGQIVSVFTSYSNGIQDVLKDGKLARTLPNGIVKINYPDGRQETKWPNGQIRLKNAQGEVVFFSPPAEGIAIKV